MRRVSSASIRGVCMAMLALWSLGSSLSCGSKCVERGGQHIWVLKGKRKVCELPAKDEGKTCEDSGACEKSYCRCPAEIERRLRSFYEEKRQFSKSLPPIQTKGTCERFQFRGGFLCVVQKGMASSDFQYVD
ncbi:MAG: hypothetical protein RBU30_12525 [Polyangia bacterium]|nr:hypothetical protein [Polyangia bacterium]